MSNKRLVQVIVLSLIAVLLLVCLSSSLVILLACGIIATTSQFIPTSVLAPTRRPMPTPTPVAIVAIVTPQPTPTPIPTPTPRLPSADQARAFARPILAAIANRSPSFADDFSDPGSGWDIRAQWESRSGWEEGEKGYANGEYYVLAPPRTCNSGRNNQMPDFSDFVLEVNGRFVSGDTKDWQVHFRCWNDPSTDRHGMYVVTVDLPGSVSISRMESGGAAPQLVSAEGTPVKPGFDTNHLQIVARGPQIALYVNGDPTLYVNDPGYTDRFKTGPVVLTICSGDQLLRVHFDNLRIWDISDLP